MKDENEWRRNSGREVHRHQVVLRREILRWIKIGKTKLSQWWEGTAVSRLNSAKFNRAMCYLQQLYVLCKMCIMTVYSSVHTHCTPHKRTTRHCTARAYYASLARDVHKTYILYCRQWIVYTTHQRRILQYIHAAHTYCYSYVLHITHTYWISHIRTCSVWLCSGSDEGRHIVLVRTRWAHSDGHEEGVVGGEGHGPRRPRKIILQHSRTRNID